MSSPPPRSLVRRSTTATSRAASGGSPGPRFVYVMGRGHSGSTILEILLGQAPSVASIGGLIAGGDRYDEMCTCGVTVGACPFWSGIRQEVAAVSGRPWPEVLAVLREQGHVRRFVRTLLARRSAPWVEEVCEANIAVLAAIGRRSGTEIVMDSSKEVTRALFLARFLPGSIVIHLVRHPESVLSSDYQRIREGRFRFLGRRLNTRGMGLPFLLFDSARWVIGNLMADVVRRRSGADALLVRYEDLCAQPEVTLRAIADAVGIDASAPLSAVAANAILARGHLLSGNPLRFREALRFDPKSGQRPPLPPRYRMCLLATRLLARKYGYTPSIAR